MSARIMQCMSLLAIFSDMKMRSMVLCNPRASHVMEPLGSVSESSALSMMSIKESAAACCVRRVGPLRYG